MISAAKSVYLATRKKHDQLFNIWIARPVAAAIVTLVARTSVTPNQLTLLNLFLFVIAAALFVALPTFQGGLVAVGVLVFSYLFDCADGMLARHKKIASREGHLFDFFTDELKAVLLVGSLGVRAWRRGGLGLDLGSWPAGDARFLLAGIAGVAIVASATSLTNFVRRPEISGREGQVEAHYESVEDKRPKSIVGLAAWAVMTFLRFLNHYPSHIWIWAAADKLDAFFWMYASINALYLARGWLGLVLRFGRS